MAELEGKGTLSGFEVVLLVDLNLLSSAACCASTFQLFIDTGSVSVSVWVFRAKAAGNANRCGRSQTDVFYQPRHPDEE